MIELSYEVVVLDNFSTGNIENLEHALKFPILKIVRADINDSEQSKTVLEDSEVLFHQAARVNVTESFFDPEVTNRTNVEGTRNLIRTALNSKTIQKIVLASSSAVYGDIGILLTPEDPPTGPISPYGLSKLRAEEICMEASRNAGLNVSILRHFNAYGERSMIGPYSGVIVKFAERLFARRSPQIFGDGNQTRDFIEVDDVAANILPREDRLTSCRDFNVGTGAQIYTRSCNHGIQPKR